MSMTQSWQVLSRSRARSALLGMFLCLMGGSDYAHAAAEPVSSSPTTSPAPSPASLLDTPVRELWDRIVSFFVGEGDLVADDIERFKADVSRDLGDFDRLVGDAGYRLTDTAVGAGLMPTMELSFEVERTLTAAEKQELRQRLESEQIGTVEGWIVRTLLDADESPLVQRSDGYQLSEVDMSVDIIPDVTFHLTKSP